MTLLSQLPGRLIVGALVVMGLAALFSAVLLWHACRRVFDVPRVPRPQALYWVMTASWAVLVTASVAIVVTALLLRDHQRLAGRTQIGELRCETTQPGHVRVEFKAGTAPENMLERYDMEGDACRVSVQEVELRPGLKPFGVHALARVDVGSLARSPAQPSWLMPLVVRSTRAVPVVVPADSTQRFMLMLSPGQAVALERI